MKVSNVAWTNLIREVHKNGLDNVMLNNEELDYIEIILLEVLDEIQDEKVSRELGVNGKPNRWRMEVE